MTITMFYHNDKLPNINKFLKGKYKKLAILPLAFLDFTLLEQSVVAFKPIGTGTRFLATGIPMYYFYIFIGLALLGAVAPNLIGKKLLNKNIPNFLYALVSVGILILLATL